LAPALLAAALIINAGCVGPLKGLAGKGAPPPPVAVDEAVMEALLRPAEVAEFKGYGEINMSGGGAKASGKIEAHRKNNGYVKAQIYSPFGTAVASISSEAFKGVVKVDKEAIEFSYGDKMENVPFPCARNFTYGQFIKSLTGAMPEAFRELPASPDSLKQSKKAPGKATAVWNSDTLSVRALIVGKKGKPPRLETVTFKYNMGGTKFSLLFAGFKKGIASEITLKEGSKNYISVKYESVVGK
jgi:hypothetical protein